MKPQDILASCNYQIIYNWNSKDRQGEVSVTWTDDYFIIKWSQLTKTLVSNFHEKSFSCLEESSKSLAYLILRQICNEFKYPTKFIFFKVDGVIEKSFAFNDSKKTNDLFFMSEEIYYNGLRPEHIKLCKKDELWAGLKDITKYHLGCDLKDEQSG